MTKLEYIYVDGKVVHVLQTKPSNTEKFGHGYIVHTYHWSIEQVMTGDFSNDSDNCMDCKYSYTHNDGESGGCYTHYGNIRQGLGSMLRRLQRIQHTFEPFNKEQFDAFCTMSKSTSPILTRLGIYGDPILLSEYVTSKLKSISKANTGYSHRWGTSSHSLSLMASVDSLDEKIEANKCGHRTFRVVLNGDDLQSDEVICPASKESKKFVPCSACGLCSGIDNKSDKNIAVVVHGSGSKKVKENK